MMLRFFILLGTTPLIYASTLGDCFLEQDNKKIEVKTIEEIYKIEKKINGDSKDLLGTPLYLAAKSGSLPLVTFLVKHGAKVNKTSNASDTPLHVASAYGHINIVKYLIKHKAQANKKNSIGKSALELASLRNKNNVVKYLRTLTAHKKRKKVIKRDKQIKLVLNKHKEQKKILKKSETFQHLPYVRTLGIVAQSQPYVKETRVTYIENKEINNIIYKPQQREETYENLPFVKSLEIVEKSKPYIESNS